MQCVFVFPRILSTRRLQKGMQYWADRYLMNQQIFDEGDRFRDFTAGPFARYYFLPVSKSTNIFLEGQFLWGSEKYEGFPGENKNGYGFTAGPVFFINPHIGLEMMAGWRSLMYKTDRGRYNTAWIGAGLQVHLEIFRFKQGK